MEYIKRYTHIYLKVITIIIFSIIIFNMNECYMYKDDEVYKEVFNNLATFKTWAWEFYNIWSGRVITSALSNIFLRMPLIIFKVCNTLVYDILILAIYKIIKNIFKTNNMIDEIIIILFAISMIIDKEVMKFSVFWVTGAFNYLWPTAFMLVAIIPFVKLFTENKKEKNINYVFYILSDLIACFAEQTALILLVFGAIAIAYSLFVRKEKISKLMIIHYIIIIILSFIELLAPGNRVRFLASTLRRYPTFYMLSTVDKLLQGMIILANQLLTRDIYLMLILTFLLALKKLGDKNKKIIFKILAFIPFLYFGISFISSKLGIFEGILYNIPNFGLEYIYGFAIYIPILLFMIIIILITTLILYSFKSIVKGILICMIFCAGISATLSVSFSPTVFASGARIFFTMDILLLIVIVSFVVTKRDGSF